MTETAGPHGLAVPGRKFLRRLAPAWPGEFSTEVVDSVDPQDPSDRLRTF